MFKKIVRIIAVIVLMALILITSALSAETKPDTNIWSVGASTSTTSCGLVTVRFNVTGKSAMTQLGAVSINLYELDGTYVKTYDSLVYKNTIDFYTDYYSGTVLHIGEAGQHYYAVVTFYASNNDGADTVTYTTKIG